MKQKVKPASQEIESKQCEVKEENKEEERKRKGERQWNEYVKERGRETRQRLEDETREEDGQDQDAIEDVGRSTRMRKMMRVGRPIEQKAM